MRIGLLAPEESGKSCFLVALYGTLIHYKNCLATAEYPLTFTISDNQRDDLERKYAAILDDNLGTKRFPAKTTEISEIQFFALHRRTPYNRNYICHDITLVDFPGEALRGRGSVELSKTVKSKLFSCDAFIVLLDARYAKGDVTSPKVNYKLAPSDIANIILARFSSDRNVLTSRGIPVALCISKFDLLMDEYFNNPGTISEYINNIKKLCNGIFSAHHPVMVTGVSLGKDIAGISNYNNSYTYDGEYEPFNVSTPLEFCCSFCGFSAVHYYDDKISMYATINRDLYEKNYFAYHSWYELATAMTRTLTRPDTDNVYKIVFNGNNHRFKHKIDRGDFPLELA